MFQGGPPEPLPSKGRSYGKSREGPTSGPYFAKESFGASYRSTLLWLRVREGVREGSAKAPCPTLPQSILWSRPPEVTGGWGQPIAEELLITKCQWSREAELNGRLRWGGAAGPHGSLGSGCVPGLLPQNWTDVIAPPAAPGSSPLEPPVLGMEPHGGGSWRGQPVIPGGDGWFWVAHTHPASRKHGTPFPGESARAQAHTHTRARAGSKRTAGHPGLRLPFLLGARALRKPWAVVCCAGCGGVRVEGPSCPPLPQRQCARCTPGAPQPGLWISPPPHPLPASGGGWRGPVRCVS